jgi:PAS domain S-box-containing protein
VDDAVLALDGDGMIWDCSAATEKLFRYRRNELVGRRISMLLPELRDGRLADQGPLTHSLQILSRINHTFAARRRDGQCFASRLSLARVGNAWIAACRDPMETRF